MKSFCLVFSPKYKASSILFHFALPSFMLSTESVCTSYFNSIFHGFCMYCQFSQISIFFCSLFSIGFAIIQLFSHYVAATLQVLQQLISFRCYNHYNKRLTKPIFQNSLLLVFLFLMMLRLLVKCNPLFSNVSII